MSEQMDEQQAEQAGEPVKKLPYGTKLPKRMCPECGRMLTRKYWGTHRRLYHGVYGGLSGEPRKRSIERSPVVRAPKQLTQATPTSPVNGQVKAEQVRSVRTLRELPNFMVTRDDDGHIWLSELIR